MSIASIRSNLPCARKDAPTAGSWRRKLVRTFYRFPPHRKTRWNQEMSSCFFCSWSRQAFGTGANERWPGSRPIILVRVFQCLYNLVVINTLMTIRTTAVGIVRWHKFPRVAVFRTFLVYVKVSRRSYVCFFFFSDSELLQELLCRDRVTLWYGASALESSFRETPLSQ